MTGAAGAHELVVGIRRGAAGVADTRGDDTWHEPEPGIRSPESTGTEGRLGRLVVFGCDRLQLHHLLFGRVHQRQAHPPGGQPALAQRRPGVAAAIAVSAEQHGFARQPFGNRRRQGLKEKRS